MSDSKLLEPGEFDQAEINQANVVAKIREPDDDLGNLLDVYRGYLWAIARRRLTGDLVAKIAPSDLVQDTLMQAIHCIDQFHGTSEVELRTWLRRILDRKLIDIQRHYRDSQFREIAREVSLPNVFRSDELWNDQRVSRPVTGKVSEEFEVLNVLLGKLDEIQRQAIQLRNFERLSFEEVGKRIGRTAGAAQKIWARAVQQLAQEFRIHEAET
jgi:RNA polymerase sigma-70 factor (ECF subfamily)